MSEILDHYVRLFSRLNTDRSRWKDFNVTRERAPHKPLLLLAIIEQVKQGMINANLIAITPDLIESFRLYWYRIMPPDRLALIALPFFHLKSDGFWELIPQQGKETNLASQKQMRSVTGLQELALGARLDDALFALLQDASSRDVLTLTLLKVYFSDEAQKALLEQEQINVEAFQYSQKLLKRYAAEDQAAQEQSEPVRTQGFRRAIVTAYEHRCAMSGIRIITPDGQSAVEAAHIVPWRISHNDDPTNGLALSPLYHWAFDRGLISVDQDYRVVLSKHLRRDRNIAGDLLAFDQRELILPADEAFYPDLEALEYHRNKIFYR